MVPCFVMPYNVADQMIYPESQELFPTENGFGMEKTMDSMISNSKLVVSNQSLGMMEGASDNYPNLLASEIQDLSANHNSEYPLNQIKVDHPDHPSSSIAKSKANSKKRSPSHVTTRSQAKKKQKASDKQDENVKSVIQQDVSLSSPNHYLNPNYQRFAPPSDIPNPINLINPQMQQQSMFQSHPGHQSPASYLVNPSVSVQQGSQFSVYSAPLSNQSQPLYNQFPGNISVQQPLFHQNFSQVKPICNSFQPTESQPNQMSTKTERPAPIYPSLAEPQQPPWPTSRLGVSNHSEEPIGQEVRSDTGLGTNQTVFTNPADSSQKRFQVESTSELTGYVPVNKVETTSQSLYSRGYSTRSRSLQRDHQVLLHTVGDTIPFGMIVVDSRMDKLEYARKLIDKHFGDVIRGRCYEFLSRDGVVIKKSQEKELLILNQAYEKVEIE